MGDKNYSSRGQEESSAGPVGTSQLGSLQGSFKVAKVAEKLQRSEEGLASRDLLCPYSFTQEASQLVLGVTSGILGEGQAGPAFLPG